MSDSTDNTNDLDSYGVWVKRPPQDSSDEADTLPDFSDFDISPFIDSVLINITPVFRLKTC